MGFEPFIPPKPKAPLPQGEGTREERVLALAKLLHNRGITSSLTDAKRLAEGMVDVERKVIKQAPKEEPKPVPAPVEQPQAPKASSGLKLPESFAHFVAQAATMSHEEPAQVSIPEPPVRAALQIAPVPRAHTQTFYAEAPDLSQARGYKDKPEFSSSRQEVVEKLHTITVEPPKAPEKAIDWTAPVEQAPLPLEKEEMLPEKTVELPKSEQPAEREDLAKKHGVDLFEMFKKK